MTAETAPALKAALAALATDPGGDLDLSLDEAFGEILSARASPGQIGAFLFGLALRGERAADIIAGALALRSAMIPAPLEGPLMDVCGTGGDGAHTLNISTAVSFVLAGGGVRVAKHGNRAMSSQSGAADVLEALGARLDAPPVALPQIMRAAGLVFLFAQAHHPAMRTVAAVRRELGVRTVFNMLGPLCNPAGAQRQVLGVYHPRLLNLMAQALQALGCERAWVVHGSGGLDELSPEGPSAVVALEDGALSAFSVSPEDAGLPRHPVGALRGGDAHANAAALVALLEGGRGAYRDTVVLNAAAAFCVTAGHRDLRTGAQMAERALDSGAAREALSRFVAETQAHAP